MYAMHYIFFFIPLLSKSGSLCYAACYSKCIHVDVGIDNKRCTSGLSFFFVCLLKWKLLTNRMSWKKSLSCVLGIKCLEAIWACEIQEFLLFMVCLFFSSWDM